MSHHKRLRRLAVAIHERLVPRREPAPQIELPWYDWRQAEALLRQVERAGGRGWHLAAGQLREDLHGALERLAFELIRQKELLEPRRPPFRASTGSLYADLLALEREFPRLDYDHAARTLSVTTEPIELEDVFLGPFEIRLEWDRPAADHLPGYRVIAREPNRAAANDGVTHPHVQDETLCEGDGRQAIRQALAQGRLLDFFLLVAQLLQTYNPDSPYVTLNSWQGVDCADCGGNVHSDERYSCEKCGADLCGDCYFNCARCEGIFCHECILPCGGCHEQTCFACLKPCARCDTERCGRCLDEQERCQHCHESHNHQPQSECSPAGSRATDPGPGEIAGSRENAG